MSKYAACVKLDTSAGLTFNLGPVGLIATSPTNAYEVLVQDMALMADFQAGKTFIAEVEKKARDGQSELYIVRPTSVKSVSCTVTFFRDRVWKF